MTLEKSLAAIVIGMGLLGMNRTGAGREGLIDAASRTGSYTATEIADMPYQPIGETAGYLTTLGGLVGVCVYGLRKKPDKKEECKDKKK